jgi:hypothetical protein
MASEIDITLKEAEQIATLLADQGIPALVIGAIALAAHHYVRSTRDVDLGVNADVSQLHKLVEVLRSHGYEAEFHEPDAEDPLGGVINVFGDFGLVQIVSFWNRFPAAIQDALNGEEFHIRPGGTLRIMPIPQLVALKLYAGGWKSLADVLELLRRNPQIDLAMLEKTITRYRLKGWSQVQEELRKDS